MSGTSAQEIGIVDYPGAQAACILGLTDFFGIASTIASEQGRSDQTALRVTHWKPIDSFDADLSCVYDSAPRGSPQPRTLIIPPTMVDPDPEIPAGVVSWIRRRHRAGATLVSLCSGAFILAATGLLDGQSVAAPQFAQYRWRGVFRKSSSIQIGASLIMATSSRRADSCHGSISACFSSTGFSARPSGRRPRASFLTTQRRVRLAIFLALLLPSRTEMQPY